MKILIFTIFVALLISLNPKQVSAVVEKNDIPTLTFDRSKEVADFELVPKPTPTPPLLGLGSQDKRSWTKSEYKYIIEKVAKRYNVDPQVIYATIMTESHGDKYAFRYEPSIDDASLCLGQILLSTAKSMGFDGSPKELYRPDICIDLVGKYVRYLLDTYGDLTPLQIATAYNTGSPWKWPVWGHLDRFNLFMDYQDDENPAISNLAYTPKKTYKVATKVAKSPNNKTSKPTKTLLKKELANADNITPTKKPSITATPKPTKTQIKATVKPSPKPTIVKIALQK